MHPARYELAFAAGNANVPYRVVIKRLITALETSSEYDSLSIAIKTAAIADLARQMNGDYEAAVRMFKSL